MKTFTFILFTTLLFSLHCVQAQNVDLFEEVNTRQLTEKITLYPANFVYVYAPLSCTMTKEDSLLTQPAVIDYYSANFNCLTIAVDSITDSLRQELKISKPGFYFIDTSFTIFHRYLLSPESTPELIQIGANALDTSANYLSVINQYQQGNRNFSFMVQYLKTRKNAYELLSVEIDEAESLIDTSATLSDDVMEFVYDYFFCRTRDRGYYYFDTQSIPFAILLKNRNQFLRYYDTAQVNSRLKTLIEFGLPRLVSDMDLEFIQQAAEFANDPPDNITLINSDGHVLITLIGDANDTIPKGNALRAFYYLHHGDTLNYHHYEENYLELSKANALGLHFMANYYYRNIDDNAFRAKARKINQLAYHADSTDFGVIGLMAEMYYSENDYERALPFIDQAIKLYTEKKIHPGQFEAMKVAILEK